MAAGVLQGEFRYAQARMVYPYNLFVRQDYPAIYMDYDYSCVFPVSRNAWSVNADQWATKTHSQTTLSQRSVTLW